MDNCDASPTAATESVVMTATLEAQEDRDQPRQTFPMHSSKHEVGKNGDPITKIRGKQDGTTHFAEFESCKILCAASAPLSGA